MGVGLIFWGLISVARFFAELERVCGKIKNQVLGEKGDRKIYLIEKKVIAKS